MTWELEVLQNLRDWKLSVASMVVFEYESSGICVRDNEIHAEFWLCLNGSPDPNVGYAC